MGFHLVKLVQAGAMRRGHPAFGFDYKASGKHVFVKQLKEYCNHCEQPAFTYFNKTKMVTSASEHTLADASTRKF